jgi:hypothetical protein
MMKNLSKVQKIVNLLIQTAIFMVTGIFIYHQIFQKAGLQQLILTLEEDATTLSFQRRFLLVFFMMVVNWGLEAYKWRYLISKVEKVGFLKALQAVFTGISVSSIIPNRVGEFFGRVFVLKTAGRIESILITVVGSISQLLITVLAGSVALLIFIPQYLSKAGFSHGYLYYMLITLVISLNVILLALYFQISFLTTLKERILKNGLSRFQKFFRVFAFYHNRELAIVMMLSFARYMVFSTQFFLLLQLFDVMIPYFNALVLIALIYFIMAIIPTVALTELGIRGSVALYIFGLYFSQSSLLSEWINVGIFAASTVLWMINIGMPALIGILFVFRLQFFRKTCE